MVGDLEILRNFGEPDERESARVASREIAGEDSVIEEGPHVFAYTNPTKHGV